MKLLNLPNILTLLNLAAGMIGITVVLTNTSEHGLKQGLIWAVAFALLPTIVGYAVSSPLRVDFR